MYPSRPASVVLYPNPEAVLGVSGLLIPDEHLVIYPVGKDLRSVCDDMCLHIVTPFLDSDIPAPTLLLLTLADTGKHIGYLDEP